MQQLNVLSINVSQNVEIKDDTNAFVSPSVKDDFLQHIDSHLSKNKDVNPHEYKVLDKNIDTEINQNVTDSSTFKSDDQFQKNRDASHNLVDETNSASQAQKIAAAGKKGEDHQIIDDPELLMSFLTQADKTLVDGGSVDENSAEGIKLGEMSAEQKAKYETQLLLESSDLVADLSDVTKAINPNSETILADLAEQEKVASSLLVSTKSTKTNTEMSQLNATVLGEANNIKNNDVAGEKLANDSKDKLSSKTLVEGKLLESERLVSKSTKEQAVNSDLLINKNNIVSERLNTDKLDEEGLGDSEVGSKKAVRLAQNKGAQQRINNEIEGKVQGQVDVDSEKTTQKELSQQILMAARKNIDSSNITLAPKSPTNINAMSSEQNPLDVESKLNSEVVRSLQGDNNNAKSEAIFVAQNANTNTNTSSNKSTPMANLGSQTITEPSIKQSSLVEPEAQLSAKSVEHLIEQSKAFSTDENKGANGNATKTNTEFSVNSQVMNATNRATQDTYDRVEQHVAEIFNPTGSAEVSQNQKSNTQLHQETIAIFRKDFSDAVKGKVMLMISQKLQQFDITLDPPELGNMQVRVNLQGEQATVNFIVQNQQAKEALEQNMHKLRDLLADQGVDVGEANVEQQSDNESNDENTENSPHNSITNTADASDAIEHSLSASMLNSSSTSVDYYA